MKTDDLIGLLAADAAPVPRHEGEQFLRGVEALREDLDRLAARLELLAQRRRLPRSHAP